MQIVLRLLHIIIKMIHFYKNTSLTKEKKNQCGFSNVRILFFLNLKANKNNQQERCQLNHSAVMHNMKVLSMFLPFM